MKSQSLFPGESIKYFKMPSDEIFTLHAKR